MINVFEHLGCYDSMTYSYSGDGPLISATELRKFLYSLDFDNKLLDRFAEWDWAFKDILPCLQDGTFWKPEPRSWREDAEGASAKEVRGETVVRQLAEALAELCRRLKLLNLPLYKSVLFGLRNDGFTLSFGKIIEAGTEVVGLPAELSAAEETVTRSKHDDVKTVLHHPKEDFAIVFTVALYEVNCFWIEGVVSDGYKRHGRTSLAAILPVRRAA